MAEKSVSIQSSSSTDALVNRIEEYLQDKKHLYAIAIEGDWGSGKTRFLEQHVRPHLKSRRKIDMVRVSMFGVADADQLYERIAMSLLHVEDNANPKHKSSRAVKRAAMEAVTSSVGGILESIGVTINGASGMRAIAELSLNDKHFLVLDDVERRSDECDDKSLFGAVNSLVEDLHIKVCLVSNHFSNTGDKASRSFDSEIREKLVWKIYHFQQSPSELAGDIFADIPDNAAGVEMAAAVHAAAERAECTNARAMIRADAVIHQLRDLPAISDETIPRENRRKAFEDAVYYVLLICMGKQPERPERPDVSDHVTPELMEFVKRKDLYAKYSAFPEIEQAVNLSSNVTAQELDEGFRRYIEDYYPDNEATIAVRRISSRLQSLAILEDQDVALLVEEYASAVAGADFSSNVLQDVIAHYSTFIRLGFECSLSTEDIIDVCKTVVKKNPEEALRNLQPVDFHFGSDDNVGRQIADKLVKYAEEIRFDENRIPLTFDRQVITGDELVAAMSEAEKQGPVILLQIEPQIVASVFAEAPAKVQEDIRNIFINNRYWQLPLNVTASKKLEQWVSLVKQEVESSKIESKTGNLRKQWFVNILEARLEVLKQ